MVGFISSQRDKSKIGTIFYSLLRTTVKPQRGLIMGTRILELDTSIPRIKHG